MSQITNIQVDLSELALESERMEAHLARMLDQVRRVEQQQSESPPGDEETFLPDPIENGKLSLEEKEMLERMFEQATHDRSKAFELKNELDRLDVFREYEDRFLDLFGKDGGANAPDDITET